MQAPTQPVFYYDLGEPECYLVAERVVSELEVVPEWEPVLAGGIGAGRVGAEGVGGGGFGAGIGEPDREELTVRAHELGLQPMRWPASWPPDSRNAMLAATYAKRIGRVVAFSLAAFRQAFAGGRDLGDEHTVLIAAAACEMHPTAVLKGIGLRSVGEALDGAAVRAREAGVSSLPAIQVGDAVFTGRDCIALADRALGALR